MGKQRWVMNLVCVALMVSLTGCCWFRGCRKDLSTSDMPPYSPDALSQAPSYPPGYVPPGQDGISGGSADPADGYQPAVEFETAAGPRPEGQVIAELEKIHFDYDKAEIRPDQLAILDRNVSYMKKSMDVTLTIEGHTDERGTDQYNVALGDRRASSVRDYMIRAGIAPSRLSKVSYGKTMPIVTDPSEWGWAQNRRAEFKVRSSGKVAMLEW